MKKFLLVLTLVFSLVLSACASGEDLQGKFGTPSVVTMTLSSSSPSGSRSVGASDDFLVFDMKASTTKTLAVGTKFQIALAADADIDTASAAGLKVYLKKKGTTIGEGTLSVVDGSLVEGTLELTSELKLSTTSTELTLNTNTSLLLAEDAGVDDPLTATLTYGTTSVTGNTVNY